MSNHTKEPWRVELQSESLDRYIVSDAEDRIVLQLLPRNLAEKIVNDHNEIAQLKADRAELLRMVENLRGCYAERYCAFDLDEIETANVKFSDAIEEARDLIKRMEAGE
jgi:hypothetical protein